MVDKIRLCVLFGVFVDVAVEHQGLWGFLRVFRCNIGLFWQGGSDWWRRGVRVEHRGGIGELLERVGSDDLVVE